LEIQKVRLLGWLAAVDAGTWTRVFLPDARVDLLGAISFLESIHLLLEDVERSFADVEYEIYQLLANYAVLLLEFVEL